MTEQPATKQCPTCGNVLDVRAPACPRCGAPQAMPTKKPDGIIWAIVFFAFVMFIVLAYVTCN